MAAACLGRGLELRGAELVIVDRADHFEVHLIVAKHELVARDDAVGARDRSPESCFAVFDCPRR